MSAIIREIFWQEYDTTTQIRTVRADIICDAIADLPSGGIMADYKLSIGSRAKVIADGSEWEIQSSGSWVRQPSKLQLDLTGYATESWVNGELAGYVPATTYSTDQAAQDAAIETKITMENILGAGRQITDTAGQDVLTLGKFYCANASDAGNVSTAPWNTAGYFGFTMRSISSSQRFVQIAIRNDDSFALAKRRYIGSWQPWSYISNI